MDLTTNNGKQAQEERENETNDVDPLNEQMNSLLRVANGQTNRPARERRFSDGAPASSAVDDSADVRSRDGTRWLPSPTEQSHRIGLGSSSSPSKTQLLIRKLLKRHACTAAVCAVLKVFDTTELLELILSYLDTKDVLDLRRTSCKWKATIETSPSLRLHFFTYPQWSRPPSDFQLLPLKLPGLSIVRGSPIDKGQWIRISMTPETARRIVPHPRPDRRVRSRSIFEGLRGGLGRSSKSEDDSWPKNKSTRTVTDASQYDELFVTQPPLLGMQAFIILPNADLDDDNYRSDDDVADPEFRPCAKLSCDAGITLGWLAETAQSLFNSQKSGPSNMDGARVVFKAIMSFTSPEHPRKRGNSRIVTRL